MENNLGAILLMLDAIRLEIRAAASDVADTRIWRDKADERVARAEATWKPRPEVRAQCGSCVECGRHSAREHFSWCSQHTN